MNVCLSPSYHASLQRVLSWFRLHVILDGGPIQNFCSLNIRLPPITCTATAISIKQCRGQVTNLHRKALQTKKYTPVSNVCNCLQINQFGVMAERKVDLWCVSALGVLGFTFMLLNFLLSWVKLSTNKICQNV